MRREDRGYQTKKGKKKQTKEEKVKVNVAIVHNNNGVLRAKRGTTLPVEVKTNISDVLLMRAAVTKHSAFHKHLVDGSKEYVLLYQDYGIVKYLPGTQQLFILDKYKEMLGKPYNRICFYLCEKEMYEVNEKETNDSSGTDGSEANYEILDSSGEITFNIPKLEETSSTSAPGCPYQTYCDLDVKMSDDEKYFDDDVDDIALQEALLASTNPEQQADEVSKQDRDALKEILLSCERNLDMFTRQVIRVRRKHIWEDALRTFNKTDFCLDCLLDVHFIGEEAADEGGPKREFFRLLMSTLAEESGVFEGTDEGKKTFSVNPVLLASNTYFQAGRMVAASLQQGGPGIRCLSPAVFWHMVEHPEKSAPSLEDIPDSEIKNRVRKIHDSVTEHEFASVLASERELLLACGISKTNWSYSEKAKLVGIISDYSVIHRCKAAIDQFKEGVMSVPSIKSHLLMSPHLFKELFAKQATNLTREEFRGLYKICFSPEGSNNREGEELTAIWWEEFVDNLGKDGFPVTLEDVLTFVTGADQVPPAGFGKQIEVSFYSQVSFEKRLPYCSTCSLEFFIPRNVKSFKEMEEMLLQAFQDCHGFGKI